MRNIIYENHKSNSTVITSCEGEKITEVGRTGTCSQLTTCQSLI